MKQIFLNCIYLLAACVLLAACDKSVEEDPIKPQEKRTVLMLTSSGIVFNKDGEVVKELPNCAYATQMISDGNDYFVSGAFVKGEEERVGYWKNGKWNTLHVDFIDDVDHTMYGIGKWDYYIYLLDYPNVLKNSGIFPLEDGHLFMPASQGLAVSNGKCYVVGSKLVDHVKSRYMPVLYTESKGKYVATMLPVPDGVTSGDCTSVYAYDTDHYLIGGWAGDRPAVWSDGTFYQLPLTNYVEQADDDEHSIQGEVKSVTMCNGVFYAVGSEEGETGMSVATLWKNSEIHHLTYQANIMSSEALEVKTYGDDVYTITREYGFNSMDEFVTTTVLWMNGKVISALPGIAVISFAIL